MLPSLQMIATLAACLFAGAALYINVAEHPARMTLDTASAARQWAPSYERATMLLHAVRTVLGLAASMVYTWLSIRRPGAMP